MNILKGKKLIYRYPLTIILFSILFLALITMFSWYGFYSPAIKKNKQQGYELKKKVSGIDYKLKSQQHLFKKLSLAKFNSSHANAISQQNKTTILLLNDIAKLSNMSNTHFSLTKNSKNSKNSIVITLQPKNISEFYTLVETIESRKHVNRLTILKNNKEFTLTLYVRYLQGDDL